MTVVACHHTSLGCVAHFLQQVRQDLRSVARPRCTIEVSDEYLEVLLGDASSEIPVETDDRTVDHAVFLRASEVGSDCADWHCEHHIEVEVGSGVLPQREDSQDI